MWIKEKGFMNIFFDEAEDLGVEEISRICQSVKFRDIKTTRRHPNPEYFQMGSVKYEGFMWLVFDDYQSRKDLHGLGSTKTNQTGEDKPVWLGNTLEEKLLSNVVQLRTIFRMTENIARYIGDRCLVPNWKIGHEAADYKVTHNIEGIPPYTTLEIKLEKLDDDSIKQKLLAHLENFIIVSVREKNHHPGHIAISLPDEDFNMLFGQDTSKFVRLLNDQIKSKFNVEDIAPQVSTEMQESLQFKHDGDTKK